MWLPLSTAAAADLPVGPTQVYTTVGDALGDAVSGDRLVVDPGSYEVRETAVDVQVEIAPASGPGTVTLVGSQGQSLFALEPGGDLTLRDLAVDGSGRRLATATSARLALLGCTIGGTEAAGFGRDGGAIDATSSTLLFDGTTVDGSLAGRDGGVVHAVSSDLTLTNSTFRNGTAQAGGALALAGGTLAVDGSLFEGNTADEGSALWLDATPLSSGATTFRANVAHAAATVRCAGAPCTLDHATFDGNTAPSGAVLASAGGSTVEVSSSTVCRASGDRAIDAVGGPLVLRNDVFVGNAVGQALVSAISAPVDVLSVHFVANSATGTGAALATSSSPVTLRNTLVAWNTAAGAVVDVPPADLSGGWSLFWQNDATDLAGPLRATDIAADPLFPEPPAGSCDPSVLVPPIASPAVDAGDPSLVDLDGSRSDIGAFGGNDDAPVVVVDDDDDGWPVALDCDDLDASVHPLATEVICDGVDQDCSPATEDAPDGDGDGVGFCDGDCDDTNANRTEYFDVYRDRDEDGFGDGDPTTLCGMPVAQASLVGGDCDDRNADRFPGNPEVPYDGVDQDCDGDDLVDVDLDGVDWPEDCDDEEPTVFPGAKEIHDDGVDQDCTGHDAVEVLVGGSGVTCGCVSGPGPSVAGLALAGLVAARRRRVTSRSGTP